MEHNLKSLAKYYSLGKHKRVNDQRISSDKSSFNIFPLIADHHREEPVMVPHIFRLGYGLIGHSCLHPSGQQ